MSKPWHKPRLNPGALHRFEAGVQGKRTQMREGHRHHAYVVIEFHGVEPDSSDAIDVLETIKTALEFVMPQGVFVGKVSRVAKVE